MARASRSTNRQYTAWRLMLILLACAATFIILPTSVTSKLSNLIQVIVPLQDAARTTAVATQAALDGAEPASSNVRAMESLVASLAAQNRMLQTEIARLTRVRQRGLGPHGKLIPARIIADDAMFWRESALVLAGTGRDVTRGLGVMSDELAIDIKRDDETTSGLGVLMTETLIGVVDSVGTHTSRVKLLSDPHTRMPVAIGRITDGRLTGPDRAFWLVGKGEGQIEVRDVHHQYVDAGLISTGDIVLTRDDEPILPPSVTIGTITEMFADPDNTLLYVLKVSPGVDLNAVHLVYVVDTTR